MNDLSSNQWLIIGGVAILVLWFKGYLTVPQFIRDRLQGRPMTINEEDPFGERVDSRLVKHGTYALAQALAEAAVKESQRNVAAKMANDLRAKLMEGLTAPFSEGGTPVTPPANATQKL